MRQLIRDSHEPETAKKAHRKRGWQLFRALVARQIVEIVPRTESGSTVRVNVELQDDFSMDQALSLYLLETIPLLDRDSPAYAFDLLTLVESILENPEVILRRQLDRIKDRAVAQMKADGVEYERRMEELEKLEYPKPLRDFVYTTFNAFADRHPWVGEENIRPKSIAREMFEQYRSFAEYVLDYDLQRVEGLLLRHLNSVYKVLGQTVPDSVKTDEVLEMEDYLRTMLRGVDSSLAEEWERMRLFDGAQGAPGGVEGRDAAYRAPGARGVAAPDLLRPGAEEGRTDVTRDERGFTAAIRTRVFAFLREWEKGPEAEAFRAEHGSLRFDPEARNLRHTYVTRADDGRTWRVQQVLVDTEGHNDWVAEFDVDLEASRDAREPVLRPLRVGPLEAGLGSRESGFGENTHDSGEGPDMAE
jgi:hypothetical protein